MLSRNSAPIRYCETFEEIAELFKIHHQRKTPIWIQSQKLDFLKEKVNPKNYQEVDNLPCVYFAFHEPELSRHLRRLVGFLLAVLGTASSLPVWFVCSVAIPFESPGPILFVDKRTGENEQPIDFYKFRTMIPNDSANQQRLEIRKKAMESCDCPQKLKDDPRITKLGQFLRKKSLDELPQFLNVINGSLDLVGPRAYSVDETKEMKPWQKLRHVVKPGVTGFWQTHGRSDISFNSGILMDLYSIANRHILEDLKYIAKTPLVMLNEKGSY